MPLHRIPSHKEDVLRTLMKLVSDLCPSDKDIPEKQGLRSSFIFSCFYSIYCFCANFVLEATNARLRKRVALHQITMMGSNLDTFCHLKRSKFS